MNKGLIKIDWKEIDKLEDEDISYFLFLEGKSIQAISKIRTMELSTVQEHIIKGKIKFGFLSKSENMDEFFSLLTKAGKEDKIRVLNSIDKDLKKVLINYIKENYVTMDFTQKEIAVWILGELRDEEGISVLTRASVNNSITIRRLAVSAMGKICSLKCENALIRALDDKNPQVVLYAINALIKIKSIKAMDKVKKLQQCNDKEYIIRAAEIYVISFEKNYFSEENHL